jgi:hypothetical protein
LILILDFWNFKIFKSKSMIIINLNRIFDILRQILHEYYFQVFLNSIKSFAFLTNAKKSIIKSKLNDYFFCLFFNFEKLANCDK